MQGTTYDGLAVARRERRDERALSKLRWSLRSATLLVILLASVAVVLSSGVFVGVGPMSVRRVGHSLTLLPSGKVLAVAAAGFRGEPLSADLYDPTTRAFSPTGNLGAGRKGWTTATLLNNGKTLIAGGTGTSLAISSAELYDEASGTFSPTGDITTTRSHHTATLLADGRVLVVGGHRFNFTNSAQASAELYDPVTGMFASTGSMLEFRQDHTVTRLPSGEVLVTGGFGTSSFALTSAEVYDPTTGAFSTVGNMAVSRGDHSATLLDNGKVLIAGGFGGFFPGPAVDSTELYDPAAGTFSPGGIMTTARGEHTATRLADGTVLIAVPLRDRCSFGRFPWLISQALSATYVAGELRLYLERNCRLPESPSRRASRGACQFQGAEP